jgi:chromosome segregation ATPase
MMHFLVHLVFMAAGAVFAGMFVDYRWKAASKKLLDKIASLQEGLTSKQSEINTLNVNLISANSKIKMLDTSLSEKEKELLQITAKEKLAKVNENTVVNLKTTAAAPNGLRKKRGPYKKKKNYGKPASNNNSGKKAE